MDQTSSQAKIKASISRGAETISSLGSQVAEIDAMCRTIVAALRGGHKLLTAGHGGSAAEALHMAEEFVGRFIADRIPLPAIALVADPTLITCIANDYGFQQLFPRQVQALGQAGDVLVIFSTSGQGEGLRLALEAARKKKMKVITLLGRDGGPLAGLADHQIIVVSQETARIQEAHTMLLHLILEAVETEYVNKS